MKTPFTSESGALADLFDENAVIDREAVPLALKLGVVLQNETFTLSVNYRLTLAEMIAAGHYDWVNGDIKAQHFPVQREDEEQLEAKLFHFDHTVSSEAAVEAMKGAGYEPACIEHLLSFGKQNPEEQRKHPIVAHGSVAAFDGGRYVPYLDRGGDGRDLHLFRWDYDWPVHFRFLAVRKMS